MRDIYFFSLPLKSYSFFEKLVKSTKVEVSLETNLCSIHLNLRMLERAAVSADGFRCEDE